MKIRPNTVAIVTGIFVFFILLSLAQEVNRQWQVEREVHKLENEAKNMQASIVELENLNEYFRTDDFQERLAREKLNYQAAGEQVVLIPDEDLDIQNNEVFSNTEKSKEVLYPQRWWNVFFGPQPGLNEEV